MKKIISLLLAMSMALALCACGGAENSAPSMAEAPTVQATNKESAENYFKVEDFKLVPANEWSSTYHSEESDHQYIPDFKFTNLYPADKHNDYPELLCIYCNYLDKDGVIIKKNEIYFNGLNCGDIIYAHVEDYIGRALAFSTDEVSTIKIDSIFVIGQTGQYTETYSFSEPIIIDVAELTGNDASTDESDARKSETDLVSVESDAQKPEADLVSVEEVVLEGDRYHSDSSCLKVKIRNLSDQYVDEIWVYYNVLDKNGDKLADTGICVSKVEAGQAAISDLFTFSASYDDIEMLEFVSYTFEAYEYEDLNRYTKNMYVNEKLIEPILFAKDGTRLS